jgi:ABC-type lipoprotein release transport system permease subunit
MIFKVAWRNIWRSKTRSLIVLSSIAIGVWAGLLIIGFSFGMNNERTASAIRSTLGHAQIHHADFLVEPKATAVITPEQLEGIRAALESEPRVTGWTDRAVLQGMIAAPKTNRAARILAIDPESERARTNLEEMMVEGTFFDESMRNPVVIGKKLADKLGVGMKKKIVLTFQDASGNLSRASFRVGGIYQSLNAQWDEFNVYITQKDLRKTTGLDMIHEVVVYYEETVATEEITDALVEIMPVEAKVLSWKDNSPELGFADDMMGIMLILVLGIIMTALLFGIINNMLMAILERRRELGMLMAIGMNKRKLFLMILLETLLLGIVGGPVGMLLGDVTIRIMMNIGVDLSSKKEGLAELGVQSIIYPEVVPEYYIIMALMVIGTALLASIIPAYRALKLNPVEAIRS